MNITPQLKPVIKISIPSELGYEKVAIAAVEATARKLGFSIDKVEDLKTAVGEACTNAIEHGNLCDPGAEVHIALMIGPNSLNVSVIDNGNRLISDQLPEGPNKDNFRGMGLRLMRILMDEVQIRTRPGRNEVQIINHFT